MSKSDAGILYRIFSLRNGLYIDIKKASQKDAFLFLAIEN